MAVAARVSIHCLRNIWIVGGGPSLRDFDFSILQGQCVIAVNDSIRAIPWATALASMDSTWIAARAHELDSYHGAKFIGIRQGTAGQSRHLPTGSLLVEFKTEPGFSDSWHCAHVQGTSGYFALQIAYLKRPSFIGLLGFDYRNPGQHHHAEYEWPSGQPADTWSQWAEAFNTTRGQIHAAGIEVINFGDSAITAFHRQPLSHVKATQMEGR